MSSNKITDEDCVKWKNDKTKNPKTGYKIQKGKGEYKKFEKACIHIKTPMGSPKEKTFITTKINGENKTIDKEICYKWLFNKYENPFTKYKINEQSTIYKTIEKACKELNITKLPANYKQKEIEKEKTKNPRRKLKREPTIEECLEWKKNK